jgi:anti-sigma factor ChrR (cupin superfamily)
MKHPPADRLRSYTQGTADVTTRVLVEAHLSLCRTCSAAVAKARSRAERLPRATLHDELDLPPFGCVWNAVEQAMLSQRCPEAAVFPPLLLGALPRPFVWPWIVLSWPARVRVALLMRDGETGSELYLCHFAPRSTFPHHRHVGLEENVVLAGRYDNGDVRAEIGDWVIGAPGTEERSRTEDRACWCLSRIEPPGVQLTGWRRWAVPFFSR